MYVNSEILQFKNRKLFPPMGKSKRTGFYSASKLEN